MAKQQGKNELRDSGQVDREIASAAKRLLTPEAPDLDRQKRAIAAKIAATPRAERNILFGFKPLAFALAVPLLLLALWFVMQKQSAAAELFETGQGEHLSVTLIDGSRVDLRGNSRLEQAPDFSQSHRNVALAGEAFFKVRKGDLPFRIQVGEALVTVVGTQFNVRERQQKIAVHVTEGIVLFTDDTEGEVRLEAGQAAHYTPSEGLSPIQDFNPQTWPRWQQHQYVFESKTLAAMCADLADDFGVTIDLPADLKNRPISGRIQSQNLDEILDLLAALVDANWTRTQNTVTFVQSAQ